MSSSSESVHSQSSSSESFHSQSSSSESVHSQTQSTRSTNDEETEVVAVQGVRYSRAMHRLFSLLNGGTLAFLQLKYQSSDDTTSPFKTHQSTILSFFIVTWVYVVLRVFRIKIHDQMLRKGIDDASHFFGALTTVLLLSIVSLAFALLLLFLWLVWFSAVAYMYYKELNCSQGNARTTHANSPADRPPV